MEDSAEQEPSYHHHPRTSGAHRGPPPLSLSSLKRECVVPEWDGSSEGSPTETCDFPTPRDAAKKNLLKAVELRRFAEQLEKQRTSTDRRRTPVSITTPRRSSEEDMCDVPTVPTASLASRKPAKAPPAGSPKQSRLYAAARTMTVEQVEKVLARCLQLRQSNADLQCQLSSTKEEAAREVAAANAERDRAAAENAVLKASLERLLTRHKALLGASANRSNMAFGAQDCGTPTSLAGKRKRTADVVHGVDDDAGDDSGEEYGAVVPSSSPSAPMGPPPLKKARA